MSVFMWNSDSGELARSTPTGHYHNNKTRNHHIALETHMVTIEKEMETIIYWGFFGIIPIINLLTKSS